MRSKLLSLLMFFLLLSSVSPWAVAETAPTLPNPRVTAQKIDLTRISYPRQVTAGQAFTVIVVAAAPTEGGICCGLVTLRGPGNQAVFFRLAASPDDGTLTGSVTLSKHAQPGTWTIERLTVRANSWEETTLDRSSTWTHSFTVVGSGSPSDTAGPSFRSLTVPEMVTPGDAYTIAVTAEDPLSGVDYAVATVQPAARLRADGTSESFKPQWDHIVKLLPDKRTGQLVGQMLMEESLTANDGLEVRTLTLYDRAGNATFLGSKELAEAKVNRRTLATRETPPDGLITSPALSVIHAGVLPYADWQSLDRDYVGAMIERLAKDRVATREYLVAELSQLQAVLNEVRQEIYTDPQSGLRFVPFATSGKWLVLNQAIAQRNRLLSVAAEASSPLTEAETVALQVEIRKDYTVTDPGDWLERAHGGNSTETRMAMAYIRVLGRSPELSAALKSPAYQTPQEAVVTDLDPDLIYFMPIGTRRVLSRVRGWPMLRIPLYAPRSMSDQVGLLFFQTGYYVGESLFSHPFDPDRSDWWADYVALRDGYDWLDAKQAMESPASNLAADFAEAFAPDGVSFTMIRSYPDLAGEQKAAFKELIQSKLRDQRSGSRPAIQGTRVGLLDHHQVTLKPMPVNGSGMVQLPAYSDGRAATEGAGAFTADRRAYSYTGQSQAMGQPIWHILWTIDREWRYQYYLTTYIRAPLLLDPVPGGTNQPTIKLTGTTLPGKAVTVGSRSVTADREGRFALDVPLKSGANELRLGVAGMEMGARVTVTYEPEGTAVPIEWEIPDKVSRKWVEGEIRTVPFAVLSVNGHTMRVGANGRMGYGKSLELGENVIQLVVTDRYGNTTTLEKRVVVSE